MRIDFSTLVYDGSLRSITYLAFVTLPSRRFPFGGVIGISRVISRLLAGLIVSGAFFVVGVYLMSCRLHDFGQFSFLARWGEIVYDFGIALLRALGSGPLVGRLDIYLLRPQAKILWEIRVSNYSKGVERLELSGF
jgi:hypothetical protein